MTLADQWRLEGEKSGIEKEAYRIFSKLLKLKFQDQAEEYDEKLQKSSKNQRELIAERILTAKSIEEVFEGI